LIVDDEPVARQLLREELREAADIEIVGEAEDGGAAIARIADLRPELVFLDLRMPGLGGLDVIHRLPHGVLPIVVIVTAYDEHAVRAYEAGALDYLLKPVSRERLQKTLERVRSLRGHRAEVAESLVRLDEIGDRQAGRSRKVVGRSGDEYYLLDLDDVLAFQAERELVWVITARQRYLSTQTLQSIHERLSGQVFQRVHRNALVNVNHVRKMAPLSSQRWLLTLSNGQQMTVSKRQAKTVREILQW
jgi:DNA-binding LytR/AlgR family response regulator